MPDLLIIKEWNQYVEDRKSKMETEEKKGDQRPDRKWHQNKGRKPPSPEKPSASPRPKLGSESVGTILPPPPPVPQVQHQGYQMPYGAPQPQMYPYFVAPSNPAQGYPPYQYYYGASYSRPSYYE